MLCVANKGIISLFCDKVSPIMKQIKKNTQEMIHLTKQRDELLPLLMNGQVSVNSDLVALYIIEDLNNGIYEREHHSGDSCGNAA